MAIVELKSYAELQKYINDWCTDNGVDADNAPHGAFWQNLSYKEFTTGSVPDYPSVKILVIGDGLRSNIVQALMGIGIFGPNKKYPQMPPGGPYMQPAGLEMSDTVKPIADWIWASCPE